MHMYTVPNTTKHMPCMCHVAHDTPYSLHRIQGPTAGGTKIRGLMGCEGSLRTTTQSTHFLTKGGKEEREGVGTKESGLLNKRTVESFLH